MARSLLWLLVVTAILLTLAQGEINRSETTTPFHKTTVSPETPFVIEGVTNKIHRVDFDGGAFIGPLNTDYQTREVLSGLAVRDGGDQIDVIVTDFSGDVLLYEGDALIAQTAVGTALSSGHPGANAPSINGRGDIYFSAGVSQQEIWRLERDPGTQTYGTAQMIDVGLYVAAVEDTEVMRFRSGGLLPGDLLVLTGGPDKIYRYPKGKPCDDPFYCTAVERQLYLSLPELATGLAFDPGGGLLIATFSGKIMRYLPADGTFAQIDFAAGLGVGPKRLAGGLQTDGQGVTGPVLLVTNEMTDKVFRFRPDQGVGTPDPALPLGGLDGPLGIDIGSGRAAPTLPGENIEILPHASLEGRFDKISREGLTNTRVFDFEDPRPLPTAAPLLLCDPDGALPGCQAQPGDFFVDLGLINVIPPHIRPLPNGAGPDRFLLIDIDTTAVFENTIRLRALEEEVLGLSIPHCDTPIFVQQPRLFYGPDMDDPPVVEGIDHFDISTGCGSNIGRGWGFSSFLIGRSLRARPVIVVEKLTNLLAALTGQDPNAGGLATLLEEGLKDELVANITTALLKFNQGKDDKAIDAVRAFLRRTEIDDGGIDDSRNVLGELRSRAKSTLFMLCNGEQCVSEVDAGDDLFSGDFESGSILRWSAAVGD